MEPRYRVRIIREVTSTFLDINDGTNYTTDVAGLWDLPQRETIVAGNYASGARHFVGARRTGRQVTLNTVIEAGAASGGPVRNAAHNAARDALIKMIPEQEEVVLETEYPGSEGGEYWRIRGVVLQMPYQDRSRRAYQAVLDCGDPTLYSTVPRTSGALTLPLSSVSVTSSSNANPTTITTGSAHGLATGDRIKITGHSVGALNDKWFTATVTGGSTFTIPVASTGGTGGTLWKDTRTSTLSVGGNTYVRPTVTVIPTAAKLARWNYAREYTITNSSSVPLVKHAVMVPFDFYWHYTNGSRIRADGGDIRVKVNRRFVNRWFGNLPASYGSPPGANYPGGVWFYVDIPAGDSVVVHVMYGNADAPAWTNTEDGPAMALNTFVSGGNDIRGAGNDYWVYRGRFMARPTIPQSWEHQWNLHNRQQPSPNGEPLIQPFTIRNAAPFGQENPSPGSPVNLVGGHARVGTRCAGYAGHALHHPLGFTEVSFSGHTRQKPGECKLVLRARNGDTGVIEDLWDGTVAISSIVVGATTTINTAAAHGFTTGQTIYISDVTLVTGTISINGYYTCTVTDADTFTIPLNTTGGSYSGGRAIRDTSSAAGTFTVVGSPTSPITVVFSETKEAVVFALARRSGYAIATVDNASAADYVKLPIASGLSVTGASSGTGNEKPVYMLELAITNDTTGETVNFVGEVTNTDAVGNYDTVLLNFESQIFTMNLEPFYYAFSTNSPIRAEPFRLVPGSNSVRVRDQDAGGLSVTFDWANRRM